MLLIGFFQSETFFNAEVNIFVNNDDVIAEIWKNFWADFESACNFGHEVLLENGLKVICPFDIVFFVNWDFLNDKSFTKSFYLKYRSITAKSYLFLSEPVFNQSVQNTHSQRIKSIMQIYQHWFHIGVDNDRFQAFLPFLSSAESSFAL